MASQITSFQHQLKSLWGQLGLAQKISIILTTGLVGIGLIVLAWWSARPEYALLYGGLSDAEAGRVISALNEAKIPYKVKAGGIYVPSDRVYAVRMQLAVKGIPKDDTGIGFEIFDKPNFGISDFVQRANYIRALQGELARTISQLDEVESARVMIVLPEHRLLADQRRKASASVFLKLKPYVELSPTVVNAIRFLVAGAVEGLEPSRVTVVDNKGNMLSQEAEPDSPSGLTSYQLALRKNLETYLASKVESMLEKVLGPGQAVVRVSADVDFDMITQTEERIDPESQVIRMTTVEDESTDSPINVPGGIVGVTTNISLTTNTAVSLPNRSTTRRKQTTTQYDFTKITSTITQTPGAIKKIHAAVLIAARMQGEGTNRVIAPRSSQELDSLRRIVENALGINSISTTQNLSPNQSTRMVGEVELLEVPFTNEDNEVIIKELFKQEKWQLWTELISHGVYVGVAIIAIGILFWMWRSTPSSVISVPPGAFSQQKGGNGKSPLPIQFQEAEGKIKTTDLLSKLIRENPDNVTEAIRNWMWRDSSLQ